MKTDCPECRRPTVTAADGTCVECWSLKDERAGRFPIHEPRRNPGFFWEELDDFVSDYGWWLLSAILFLVVGLIGLAAR